VANTILPISGLPVRSGESSFLSVGATKPRGHIYLARDLLDGRLVTSERSSRQPGRGRYRCLDPTCCSDLTVGRSKKGRMFFKHFPAEAKGCRFHLGKGSKTRHDLARDLLATLLGEVFERRCPMPSLRFETPGGLRFAVPIILGASVETEWRTPEGRVPDIAVLDHAGRAVVLFEVYHTHAVDRMKRYDLASYWWIEIDANAFLEQDFTTGLYLHVTDHNNLPYEYEILGRQGGLFDATSDCAGSAIGETRRTGSRRNVQDYLDRFLARIGAPRPPARSMAGAVVSERRRNECRCRVFRTRE